MLSLKDIMNLPNNFPTFLKPEDLMTLRTNKEFNSLVINTLFTQKSPHIVAYQKKWLKWVVQQRSVVNAPISHAKIWQWLTDNPLSLTREDVANGLLFIAAKKNIHLAISDELFNRLINNDISINKDTLKSIKLALTSNQIAVLIPQLIKWLDNNPSSSSALELLRFILPTLKKKEIQILLSLVEKKLMDGYYSRYGMEILAVLESLLKDKTSKKTLLSLKIFNEVVDQVNQGDFTVLPSALMVLKNFVPTLKNKDDVQRLLSPIKNQLFSPYPGISAAACNLLLAIRPLLSEKVIRNLLVETTQTLTHQDFHVRRAAIEALSAFVTVLNEQDILNLVPILIESLNENVLRQTALATIQRFILLFKKQDIQTLLVNAKRKFANKKLRTVALSLLEILIPVLGREDIEDLLTMVKQQLNAGKKQLALGILPILTSVLQKEDIQDLLPTIRQQLKDENNTIRWAAIKALKRLVPMSKDDLLPEIKSRLCGDVGEAVLLLKDILWELERSDIEDLLLQIEEQLNSENFSLQRAALNTLEILGPILSSKDITILGSVVKKVGTPQFIFTALSILESFIPILERESLQGLLLAIVSKIKGYYDPFSDDFLQLLKCNPTPSKEQAQLFIIKLTAAIARQGDTNNTGFGDLAVNFIGLQVVDHTLLKEVSWVDSSFFEIMTTWLKQLAMLDLPKKSSAHHSFFRAPPLTEKRGDLLENEVESNHLSK